MSDSIKICFSPNDSGIHSLMGIPIQVSFPSDDKSVTFMFGVNITHYNENDDKGSGTKVRQVQMANGGLKVFLSLEQPQERTVINKEGKKITLKLMGVTKEEFEGQYFNYYELFAFEPE